MYTKLSRGGFVQGGLCPYPPFNSQYENTKISLIIRSVVCINLKRTDNSCIMLRDNHFYFAKSYSISNLGLKVPS